MSTLWEDFLLSDKNPSLMIPIAAARRHRARTGEASPEEIQLKSIEAEIQSFWDLMLRQSELGGGVSYSAYEQLHLRVSKSLSTRFTKSEAQEVARYDWKADAVQVVGAEDKDDPKFQLKQRFKAAAYTMSGTDWVSLFKSYDKDGNGELDPEEFTKACRKYISSKTISNTELLTLYDIVDSDGSGSIDAGEFYDFFFQGFLNKSQFFTSLFELAEMWVLDPEANPNTDAAFDPVTHSARFCEFLSRVLNNITCATVQLRDGRVVRTKGTTDLRNISFGEDSYELEKLVDPNSVSTDEPPKVKTPPPAAHPEPEPAPAAAEPEPEPGPEPGPEPEPEALPEPEDMDPAPEPPSVLSFLPLDEVQVMPIAVDSEPQPEKKESSGADDAAACILRLVLNLVDKEVRRKKTVQSVTEAVAIKFRTSVRRKRESAAPPKPTGAVVPMCTTRPSYGSHSPRRGPDVSIRPDGAPAKGLRHGSSTFRPTPPARTPEFARSRPDSDLGNLSTRLLATSRAATLGATAGTGSVGSASSIEGSNERPRMPCRPLKLITGSTAVGQSSITPPASANYCRLPPVQMVEKHHGLLYKSVEIRSEQPGSRGAIFSEQSMNSLSGGGLLLHAGESSTSLDLNKSRSSLRECSTSRSFTSLASGESGLPSNLSWSTTCSSTSIGTSTRLVWRANSGEIAAGYGGWYKIGGGKAPDTVGFASLSTARLRELVAARRTDLGPPISARRSANCVAPLARSPTMSNRGWSGGELYTFGRPYSTSASAAAAAAIRPPPTPPIDARLRAPRLVSSRTKVRNDRGVHFRQDQPTLGLVNWRVPTSKTPPRPSAQLVQSAQEKATHGTALGARLLAHASSAYQRHQDDSPLAVVASAALEASI